MIPPSILPLGGVFVIAYLTLAAGDAVAQERRAASAATAEAGDGDPPACRVDVGNSGLVERLR